MTVAPSQSNLSPRLNFPGLIAFSLPGLCIGALAVAVSVYLPRYYAGHLGLGLSAVGLAFGAVRLFDMTFDPVIGVLMDRTRTGLGRYSRCGSPSARPVLMIPVYMLFMPRPPGSAIFI